MVSWMLFEEEDDEDEDDEDEDEKEGEGAIWFDTDSKYSNTYKNSMKKCVYNKNNLFYPNQSKSLQIKKIILHFLFLLVVVLHV
jgi:hypothetical protein